MKAWYKTGTKQGSLSIWKCNPHSKCLYILTGWSQFPKIARFFANWRHNSNNQESRSRIELKLILYRLSTRLNSIENPHFSFLITKYGGRLLEHSLTHLKGRFETQNHRSNKIGWSGSCTSRYSLMNRSSRHPSRDPSRVPSRDRSGCHSNVRQKRPPPAQPAQWHRRDAFCSAQPIWKDTSAS